MTSQIDRIKRVRDTLGKSQKEMALDLDLGVTTWQTYERGLHKPGWDVLEKLAALGFSPTWLLTGEGEMRPGGAGAASGGAAATIDAELYGRVTEAVSAAYKECGYTMALRDIAAEAAKIAADLSDDVSPEDRPAAIRGAIGQLRRRLREALTNPDGATASTQKA